MEWFDFSMISGKLTIWKVIYVLIFLTILGLQIYSIFYVFPVEKKVFEECNQIVLCENGYLPLDHEVCMGYRLKKDIPVMWNYSIE